MTYSFRELNEALVKNCSLVYKKKLFFIQKFVLKKKKRRELLLLFFFLRLSNMSHFK
jgi:hypothetical protein